VKFLYAIALLSAFCVLPVSANQPPGSPPVPQVLANELNDARFAGQAKLKVLGFQIYDAKLWVASNFKSKTFSEHAFGLELAYLRNVSGEDIAVRSLDEMRRFATLSPDQETQWLRQMREVFPSVQKGDRLVGINQPGVGATFHFNGKLQGEIRDPEFARLFFGIWLFETTAKPWIRKDLLTKLAP
jgi:Chalcone isomerase-like